VRTLLRATSPALHTLRLTGVSCSEALLTVAVGSVPPPVVAGLHTLDLSFSGATDRVLGALPPCRRLVRLVLTGAAAVTDAGVAAVAASSPALADVDLRECPHLTDAAVTAVCAGGRVTRLLLYETGVSAGGLAAALGPSAASLGELETGLPLTDALAASLGGPAALPSLTSLDALLGAGLTAVGAGAVAAAAPRLTALHLNCASLVRADAGALLVALPGGGGPAPPPPPPTHPYFSSNPLPLQPSARPPCHPKATSYQF